MTNWKEKDEKLIWHPFTALKGSSDPIFVSSASGVYLHTDDGRKIIDGISSWWVNIHGHSNPYIANAIAAQANKLEHVIFAGFTHEPAITLAENLLSALPDHFSKIFYSDNGSTSVEVALKLAIQFWKNKGRKKSKIIAFEGAYHGDTFGAMSVGDRSSFTQAFSDYLFEVQFIDFPSKENEDKVIQDFKRLAESGDVAVFIFEPLIQAAAGMRIYSSELLDKLISIALQNEVITIADEVFTGFYRTGKMFASDYLVNKPDLICLSKGITGGSLPLGVTACSEKIVSEFQSSETSKTFFHGHSFTANPISCAAANASFELLMKKDCKERIDKISSKHKLFTDEIAQHKAIRNIRFLGTLLAIEINTGSQTSYFNNIRSRISSFFIERDILLRPLGNVVYVLPPYVITENELDKIYQSLTDFLNEIAKE